MRSKCQTFLVTAFFLLLAGCVNRTIVVESDPPGARIWINEHPVGVTPAKYEFITHGRYRIRLEKKGYQELIAREMVRAPIYQWIPLDLVFEQLLPVHLEDKHLFRYVLTPQAPAEHLSIERPVDFSATLVDLESSNSNKRRSACVELARLRDPSTAGAVLEATHDPSPEVRAVALSAWRSIKGPKGMKELIQALHQDPERIVRWQAATELEALGSHDAVPDLIAALRDRDPLVRTGAAEGLKGIPDAKALQPLIRALGDKDSSVRRAATEGLGLIGDRAAVRPLIWALYRHDFQTRRKAAEALAKLKDPSSEFALVHTFTDWDPHVRTVATNALVQFGDERIVPLLIRRLRGFRPWTRQHAATVLGALKDQRAVEPLARAFRVEPDPPASAAMLEALKALGAKLEDSWEKTLSIRVEKAERKKKKTSTGPGKQPSSHDQNKKKKFY